MPFTGTRITSSGKWSSGDIEVLTEALLQPEIYVAKVNPLNLFDLASNVSKKRLGGSIDRIHQKLLEMSKEAHLDVRGSKTRPAEIVRVPPRGSTRKAKKPKNIPWTDDERAALLKLVDERLTPGVQPNVQKMCEALAGKRGWGPNKRTFQAIRPFIDKHVHQFNARNTIMYAPQRSTKQHAPTKPPEPDAPNTPIDIVTPAPPVEPVATTPERPQTPTIEAEHLDELPDDAEVFGALHLRRDDISAMKPDMLVADAQKKAFKGCFLLMPNGGAERKYEPFQVLAIRPGDGINLLTLCGHADVVPPLAKTLSRDGTHVKFECAVKYVSQNESWTKEHTIKAKKSLRDGVFVSVTCAKAERLAHLRRDVPGTLEALAPPPVKPRSPPRRRDRSPRRERSRSPRRESKMKRMCRKCGAGILTHYRGAAVLCFKCRGLRDEESSEASHAPTSLTGYVMNPSASSFDYRPTAIDYKPQATDFAAALKARIPGLQ